MEREKMKRTGIVAIVLLVLYALLGDDLIAFIVLTAIGYLFLKWSKKNKEDLDSLEDGEPVVFSASTLLFWIKGSVRVGERNIVTRIPNRVFFGLVPAGSNEDTIPMRNISNVRVSSNFRIRDILIGVFLMFTIALIPLGLLFLDSGIQYQLIFEKSGTFQYFSVPFFNRHALYVIKDQVERKLEAHDEKSDLSLYFERKDSTSQSNLSKQLSELKELVAEGHLSEEEFEIKRRELLGL